MNEFYNFTSWEVSEVTGEHEVNVNVYTASEGGTTVTELSEMFLKFLRASGYVNKVDIGIYVLDDSRPNHTITLGRDSVITNKISNSGVYGKCQNS